jgi:rod shape-determining protein MreD
MSRQQLSGQQVNGLAAKEAEPSLARKALAAVVLAVALLAAVIVQLTVVNRLPLSGDAWPDLVLLVVTAIAVFTSPLAGALAGFAGGLALDVAPPALHYAGEDALVFCLAGWGAARVNRAIRDARGERDQVVAFAVMAGAAAAGEAGKAALGMMLSDPDVTGTVASRVLPIAILYDLLAAPFVFWLVARITRGADPERAPAPEFSVEQRLAQVFRSAADGAAPGLRLAGTGENYHKPPAAGRAPWLRLSDGRAGSSTYAAAPGGAASPLAGGRARRLSFGGDLPARTGQVQTGPRASRALGNNWLAAAWRASRGPGSGWLTTGTLGGPPGRRGARTPGAGWIRAAGGAGLAGPSVKRGSRSPGKGWITAVSSALPAGKRASRAPGQGWIIAGSLAGPSARRNARGPGRDWLRAARPGGPGGPAAAGGVGVPRSAAEALAARSAPSGLSALSGRGTPMAATSRPHRAPRSGWLGTARSAASAGTAPRLAPRRGWLRGASRPPGRAYRGNWYAAAPSGQWLRRGRHPWRKRSFLPGGRPPVPPGARTMASPSYRARGRQGWMRPPGARPMANSAIASAARRLGIFGGRR